MLAELYDNGAADEVDILARKFVSTFNLNKGKLTNKKRAYNYIKKLQESFAIIITEPQDNKQKVIGCNDSSEKISGTYKIFDAENKNEISSGTFSLHAGELKELDIISDFSSTQNLFSIEWILDSGKKGENHYLCGKPPFDFERLRKILPR